MTDLEHDSAEPVRQASSQRHYSRREDALFVGFLILVGVLFLSPALKDGFSFGGFDYDTSRLSPLGAGLYNVIHSTRNSDAVSQMVTWNYFNWQSIHDGVFPLWNSYSVLGVPHFLNFESSVLSLPDLVSYLAPARSAFLVVVEVKLLLAGLGTYFFARVLGLRPSAAALSGVSFMLAGAFVNWLTWPLTDVAAYAGWICAFGVLSYRHRSRKRFVLLLGVAFAFSIYGGFPEENILMAIAFAVAGATWFFMQLARRQSVSLSGLCHIAGGLVLGGFLAAPLWLPGIEVISKSLRSANQIHAGIPMSAASLFVAQGYDGLPIGSNATFLMARPWSYYETVTYVGVLVLIFALTATILWRRHRFVGPLCVATLLSFLVSYQTSAFHPFQGLINHFSTLGTVDFQRMRSMTAFLLAILAGFGLELILRHSNEAFVRRAFLSSAIGGIAVVGVLVGNSFASHLNRADTAIRRSSLIWPIGLCLIAILLCLLVLSRQGALLGNPHWRTATATIALLSQGSFLFFAGVGIPSYSKQFYAKTPAESALQRVVGNQLVGLDTANPTTLRKGNRTGFFPNVNIGYGIRMFAVHDPLILRAYFSTWPGQAGHVGSGTGFFYPDINSAALARYFGINDILATAAVTTAPPGTVRVGIFNNEVLYRVPGSSQFSFAGAGKVLSTQLGTNGSVVLRVKTPVASKLILRITANAGWHVTSDGKTLSISTVNGVMQEVTVPAGAHTIHAWYWPERLTWGIGLSLVGLFGFFGWVFIPKIRTIGLANLRRRRRSRETA